MWRIVFYIGLSFLLSLILTIIPLPLWASWYRPQWVLLVLIFWVLFLPNRIGLLVAFCLGLFMDLLTSALLGQHALIYVLITYVVIRFHPRIQMYPILQQTLIVFMLIVFSQVMEFWIEGLLGHMPTSWRYWMAPIISTVIWPWVYAILRDYKRRYRVD